MTGLSVASSQEQLGAGCLSSYHPGGHRPVTVIQIITKIDSTKYQLINTFIGVSPVIIIQLHQAGVVKFNIKIYPARKLSQALYLSLILCKTLKDHEVNNEYLMYYTLYNVSQPMIKDPYILY